MDFTSFSIPSWGAMFLGAEMVWVVSGERLPHMLFGDMNLSFLPASLEEEQRMGCVALPWQIYGYHTLVLTLGFLWITCFSID